MVVDLREVLDFDLALPLDFAEVRDLPEIPEPVFRICLPDLTEMSEVVLLGFSTSVNLVEFGRDRSAVQNNKR